MTGDGRLSDAHRVAEQAARTSYGRLIAILAARTRDVAAAEDALADAFRTALETWPLRGIPVRPEAWLLTAARHRLDHGWRLEQVKVAATPTLATIAEDAAMTGHTTFPDERLKLLFVSAHPAIDPAIQAPLMLQTVLGLEATHIASAFLVSPTAMGQRLVRAKSKIRDAGIAFEVPEGDALPERLTAVLAAIYAAYGTGWEDVLGGDPKRKGLTEEAIWLARALVALSPKAGAKGPARAYALFRGTSSCPAHGSRRICPARSAAVPIPSTYAKCCGFVMNSAFPSIERIGVEVTCRPRHLSF